MRTHYTIAATETKGGGIVLASGMYTRADAADSLELARLLARPRKLTGPSVITRVESVPDGDGWRRVGETIVEVLPD